MHKSILHKSIHMNLPSIVLASALAFVARAETRLASGHADIGVGYHGGFDLHVHQEEPFEAEYAPDEVTFVVGEAARTTSPGGLFAASLGPAGSVAWVLSTSPQPDLPFIGFGTEELAQDDWLGNISLTLSGFSGPGNLAVWSVGAFGNTEVAIDTTRGAGLPNSLSLAPGTHAHYNLGFSQPGLYEVSCVASGTHATDGVASGAGTYRFEVVPEPSTWALLGLGGAVALFAARRRP
jgi:surface-anchored protein